MGSGLNLHGMLGSFSTDNFRTKSTQNITGNKPNFHDHIEFQKEVEKKENTAVVTGK